MYIYICIYIYTYIYISFFQKKNSSTSSTDIKDFLSTCSPVYSKLCIAHT